MIRPAKSFREDMGELFEDLRSEFEYKTTLTYLDNAPVNCIKIPVSMRYQMQLTGYAFDAETTVDMLKADALAIGLYQAVRAISLNSPKRPIVTVQAKRFHVLDIKDDDESDPTVKFMLSPVQ